ncbi:lamin tail domain-containing protein [Verrucomicrobiaceae bacterium 227]
MKVQSSLLFNHHRWWVALLALGWSVPVPVEARVFTGPCTRRTSVVLSEIHYHPAGTLDRAGEFIELYNSSPISVDLSGWQIRGDVDFEIPVGTRLGGGEFVVIAADPATMANAGVAGTVLGPWSGRLSNNSGTVRVRKASGGIVLETHYHDNARWPPAADGAGHSLVLAHPSYGEGSVQAWAASANPGGSPGGLDPVSATSFDEVVISEVLTAGSDFVELYNAGSGSVDLTGCSLSHDPDLAGYIFPSGTLLPGAYLVLTSATLGFSFDATGDEVYFRDPAGRVVTARKLGAQNSDHSWGGLTRWGELATPSPGAVNSEALRRAIVINELHYHPSDGENSGEFIELFNNGASAVDLSGWVVKDGVDFVMPDGVTIAAGAYLIVAENRAELLERYPNLDPDLVFGDYSGSLSNSSDRVELRDALGVIVDEVIYFDGGRWPDAPDGGGSSLQLIDPDSDNSLAPNWTAGDESASAQTITLEDSGVLDLGHPKAPEATRFFMLLGGKGEAVIENVEVIVNGENLVSNGSFESGSAGWKFFGTHSASVAEGGALRLVASDGGDLANLVEASLTESIPPGATVTLRARCRWVSGDPDILLGLNGGWLEAAGTLPVPVAVGTPGGPNFSAGNAGPAITEVSHFPLLPQTGEPIVVTARVDDPDGVASVRLRYRIDPSSSTQQVIMAHQGEGIYTGTIPAQSSSKMVAFHLLTIDSGSPPVITRFPVDATDRECLVKVGEVTPEGDLSTMRIWITDDTLTEWRDRTRSSNLDLDATFVSDGRVFYNAGVHYAGSQNGVTIYDSPIGNPTGYNVSLPKDEVFLNTQKLTIDRETTRDATRQRERLLFWFLEKLGLPNLHRRYVHVSVNGIKRDSLIMEDVQKPNRDVMDEWFPDSGRLTKTNPWFEFDDDSEVIIGTPGSSIGNRLEHFRTTGGELKMPRYRWNWSHGAGHESAHDFSGLFELISAAESPDAELVERMREKADLRQWMRTFAANDLGSYWDTFGNPGSKNAYLFESLESGKWSVVVWDMDVGLGVFNDPYNADLFPSNVDPNIQRLYDDPNAVRDYWQALDESLNSFFTATAGSEVRDILQETYDVLLANGAAVTSPFVPSGPDGLSVDVWINQRHAFLQSQLAGKSAPFTASGPISSDSVFTRIGGTLPLAATAILANGVPLILDHGSITGWSSEVALQPGANTVFLEAFDSVGARLGSETLEISYTGSETWAGLKINEWMASNSVESGISDPVDGDSDDWIELYNPTENAVSLEGWALSDDREDPSKFRVPPGFTIPARGYLLVWADDEPLQNDAVMRQEIHVPFKLSSEGEMFVLTAPDGAVIDLVEFGEQTSNIARLRQPDGGGDFAYSLVPTPGTPNSKSNAPAAVISPALEGGGLALTFRAESGVVYLLESSSDLFTWTPSGAPFPGNGSNHSIIPGEAVGNRRFFRIKSY